MTQDEYTQSWANIPSGIPQASVLGSILGVDYINDFQDVVRSTVKIFADNNKLLQVLHTPDDINNQQQDLDSLIS